MNPLTLPSGWKLFAAIAFKLTAKLAQRRRVASTPLC